MDRIFLYISYYRVTARHTTGGCADIKNASMFCFFPHTETFGGGVHIRQLCPHYNRGNYYCTATQNTAVNRKIPFEWSRRESNGFMLSHCSREGPSFVILGDYYDSSQSYRGFSVAWEHPQTLLRVQKKIRSSRSTFLGLSGRRESGHENVTKVPKVPSLPCKTCPETTSKTIIVSVCSANKYRMKRKCLSTHRSVSDDLGLTTDASWSMLLSSCMSLTRQVAYEARSRPGHRNRFFS